MSEMKASAHYGDARGLIKKDGRSCAVLQARTACQGSEVLIYRCPQESYVFTGGFFLYQEMLKERGDRIKRDNEC